MRNISASPIDFTCVPPKAGSSARTVSLKSATRLAASSSPWASVSAVKPAMSAKRKVAGAEAMPQTSPRPQRVLFVRARVVLVTPQHHAEHRGNHHRVLEAECSFGLECAGHCQRGSGKRGEDHRRG